MKIRSIVAIALLWSTYSLTSSGQQAPYDTATNEEASGDSLDRETIVDEITVTAQKREAGLQNVAISISVLTQQDLETQSLHSIGDLSQQVPGLELKSNFGISNPTIFLRGVGFNEINANAVGAVGLYVDEVYQGAPSGQGLQLFDLERVEVLKGPQGTLFGKNTTGGAIHLISRQPTDELSGRLRLTGGRFHQGDLEGALNLPVGKNNGLRFAVVSNNRDGYTHNTFDDSDENDIENSAARLQLRLVPSDDTTIAMSLHGGANRAGNRVFENRGLINGADPLGYVESPDPYSGAYNRDSREDIDLLGGSVTLNILKSDLLWTSITAFDEVEKLALEDTDSSPNRFAEIDYSDESEQISQELRLSGSSGSRDWVLGAFYLEQELTVSNFFDLLGLLRDLGVPFDPINGPFSIRQAYTQDTESVALFGQIDHQLSSRLTLSFGARWTKEEKELDFGTGFEEALFTIPLIDAQDEIDFSEPSGRLGLIWSPNDRHLVYGTLSRGFKSGGWNGGALIFPQELSRIEPEIVNSFEVGWKSSWMARRLTLNSALFFYDYDDLQVRNVINTGPVPVQGLENASDARINGLELDLRARPKPGMLLGLDLSLLDTEYREYVRGDGTSFSGNPLISAPDMSLTTFLSHTWLCNRGAFQAHLDFNYRDDLFYDATANPLIGTEAYGLLNGRLAFDTANDKVTVAIWGKNLNDELYLSEVIDNSAFGSHKLAVGAPRTYGIDLIFRF